MSAIPGDRLYGETQNAFRVRTMKAFSYFKETSSTLFALPGGMGTQSGTSMRVNAGGLGEPYALEGDLQFGASKTGEGNLQPFLQ